MMKGIRNHKRYAISLMIASMLLMMEGCSKNKEKIDTQVFQCDSITDTDCDGLADRFEKQLGLKVGVADANALSCDPLLQYQWFLDNRAIVPQRILNTLKLHEDINVKPVWAQTIGERNISVSIVDTGIDILHSDLDVDREKSYNYSTKTSDPSPTAGQLYEDSEGSAHGTACAGIVAAKGWNYRGVRGVAPNIDLVGLNVFSNPTDSSFSDALQREGIDVSSNSWGGGGANFLYDDATSLEAIESGAKLGRAKKGVVYVFASGNDDANSNFQSILTSGYVIAVNAVDGQGKREPYSNYGANSLLCAPGGASDTDNYPAIVTTDLTGLENGMDNYQIHWSNSENTDGNYTLAMNGTSAACPMVSGVVALMLSVNPNLRYQEVQYILAKTARKNDPYDSSWKINDA